MHRNILGFYVSRLMAFLAFRPWFSSEALREYKRAIEQRAIPKLKKENIDELLPFAREVLLEDYDGDPGVYLPKFIAWALSQSSS